MIRVSACLIVRNEASMLPACLASLAGAVDEIIVVDTGSEDATVAIAEAAGAKVSTFTWCDDFAAARNASIERATGDFVLVIDADERLAPGAAKAIRDAVRRAAFDCGMLPLHNASRVDASPADVVAGSAREGEINHLPRLLRRTRDLRFTGIVHESVLPWLRERGMKIAFVPAPIVHAGGAPDLRRELAKSARNAALLERLADIDADDPTPLGYLAHEYLELDRRDDARRAAERGWARIGDATPRHVSILRLAVAKARLELEAGDETSAIATLARAEGWEGGHADLDFLRGVASESLGWKAQREAARDRHLEAAKSAYEAAVRKADQVTAQSFVRGATSWAASTRLATIALVRGRFADARRGFELALAQRPGHVEAELGLLECRLDEGDHAATLAKLPALLGDHADGWLLAAAAAEDLGALDDFRLFLARARNKPYLSPHRRGRHIALHLALSAYLGSPAPGPGAVGVITSVMAGVPPSEPLSLSLPRDARMVERLAKNIARTGRAEALHALMTRASDAWPGLAAIVVQALGAAPETHSTHSAASP